MKWSTMTVSLFLACACWVVPSGTTRAEGVPGESISFEKRQLDTEFRSEGIGVGDLNGDQKNDIVLGTVFYAAPDWKMHRIAQKPQVWNVKRYSDSFCVYIEDLNGDGHNDVIQVDFPGKQTWWYANPGNGSGSWQRHACIERTGNESPTFADIDGDGKRELIAGVFDSGRNVNQNGKMGIARPVADPTKLWTTHAITEDGAPSTRRFAHGLGVGDINGDKHNDVIIPQGWWQNPGKPDKTLWVFHKANFGQEASNMFAYDFDGDGDNDVLGSSPHKYGLWWYEQTDQGWKQHAIDGSFSQLHAVCLIDINGDGLKDIVTGKRWYAHGGKDPGGKEPAVLYWFELSRTAGKPVWKRHTIDEDSGIGTHFTVADVDGDKLLDIAIANKKGVFYFRQQRK